MVLNNGIILQFGYQAFTSSQSGMFTVQLPISYLEQYVAFNTRYANSWVSSATQANHNTVNGSTSVFAQTLSSFQIRITVENSTKGKFWFCIGY